MIRSGSLPMTLVVIGLVVLVTALVVIGGATSGIGTTFNLLSPDPPEEGETLLPGTSQSQSSTTTSEPSDTATTSHPTSGPCDSEYILPDYC